MVSAIWPKCDTDLQYTLHVSSTFAGVYVKCASFQHQLYGISVRYFRVKLQFNSENINIYLV